MDVVKFGGITRIDDMAWVKKGYSDRPRKRKGLGLAKYFQTVSFETVWNWNFMDGFVKIVHKIPQE